MNNYFNSILELYETEKYYLSDLIMWGDKLKKTILAWPNINHECKKVLCNKIFLNLDDIINLHSKVLDYFKLKLSLLWENEGDHLSVVDIGISDVFSRLFSEFEIYKYYIQMLPMAEYTFLEEIRINSGFAELISKFFENNNIYNLGYNHFIFRPVQRLSRYILHLNTIDKYEINKAISEQNKKIIHEIKTYFTSLDALFSKSKNQFKIFLLSKNMKYKNTGIFKTGINLLSIERKIIMESEILVLYSGMIEPFKRKVILFDNAIIVVDIVMQNEKEVFQCEKIFSIDSFVVYDTNEEYKIENYLDHKYYFFICDNISKDFIALFFKDNKLKKEWMLLIYGEKIKQGTEKFEYFELEPKKEIIHKNVDFISQILSKRHFNNKINLVNKKLKNIKDFDDYFEKTNFSSLRNALIIHKRNEYLNLSFYESDNDYCNECPKSITHFKTKKFVYELKLTKQNNFSNLSQDNLFYSIDNAMFFASDSFKICTLDGKITEIICDVTDNLLFFLKNDEAYVNIMPTRGNKFSPLFILNFAYKIFCFSDNEIKYVAFCTKESNYTKIYLYIITNENINVVIKLIKTFYIGCLVEHIALLNENLIISGDIFIKLDINTSIAQNLLHNSSYILKYYNISTDPLKAKKCIFISKESFLLCFDTLGFIVNSNFEIINLNLVFTWTSDVKDFYVYKNILMITGINSLKIYSLQNADPIQIIFDEYYKIIYGNEEIFLFNNGVIYSLVN